MAQVPIFVNVGAMAAAQAAAEAMRREEEDMTQYEGNDMDGWEFKIVRSSTGKFKNRDFVRQVCDEEAKSGWVMLEKFDSGRIRFKRKVEERNNDRHRQLDPYRTNVGIGSATLGLTIAGLIIGITAAVVLAVFFFAR